MNKTKHITQEGGGMNENGTGVPGTEAPFPKGSWQHAVDDELVNFGRTSQEFATPHEAVQWLITETVECARTVGVLVDAAPSGLDREQLRRIALELEELNLKLHGTEHNSYRPGIVCAAALMRAVAGVMAAETQQEKP